MVPENAMTQESYNKLKKERDELIAQRPEIAEKLKEARAFGDLSENAEYDVAKEEQAKLEEKILKLSERLRTANILKEDELTLDKVNLGLTVKVKNTKSRQITNYSIVDPTETDPFSEPVKISIESPVGKALLGSKKGDKVEVTVPSGTVKLEIMGISKTA